MEEVRNVAGGIVVVTVEVAAVLMTALIEGLARGAQCVGDATPPLVGMALAGVRVARLQVLSRGMKV